jgi:hypothetical protein
VSSPTTCRALASGAATACPRSTPLPSPLDDNLVKMVVDTCGWWKGGGGKLEGVVRLIGGGRVREGE